MDVDGPNKFAILLRSGSLSLQFDTEEEPGYNRKSPERGSMSSKTTDAIVAESKHLFASEKNVEVEPSNKYDINTTSKCIALKKTTCSRCPNSPPNCSDLGKN